jgi:hypothetical protein
MKLDSLALVIGLAGALLVPVYDPDPQGLEAAIAYSRAGEKIYSLLVDCNGNLPLQAGYSVACDDQ